MKLENGSGSSTQRQNPCPEQPGGLDAVAPAYLFGGLLAQIQTRVLYFFWDGQHWVPQEVLFLPREEGGQGLIHLASRVGIYRVQCLQRGHAWTDGSNMLNPDPSPETPIGLPGRGLSAGHPLHQGGQKSPAAVEGKVQRKGDEPPRGL